MASEWNDKRPMAPHLQVWRWHASMLSSILHRACAIISYVALIKFSFGLLYFLLSGNLPLKGLLYSPLGAIGLFVGVFALVFMVLAQLRHFIWDKGKLLDPELNNKLSYFMIGVSLGFAVIATLGMSGVI